MLTYLSEFFDIFEYPLEARSVITESYKNIAKNPNLLFDFNALLNIYADNINCDYLDMLQQAEIIGYRAGIHEYTVKLLLFICLSKKLRENYKGRSISDDIWKNSMLDLKYKLFECKEVHGIWGSFVAWWFGGFFDLTRFGLGRLQFEIIPFEYNYSKNGVTLTPESPVINVHIPRTCTPLCKEETDRAYKLAEEFFKDKLSGAPVAFFCDSWLLFKKHWDILSPSSNIYRFISDYDLVDFGDFDDYDELWRLFDIKYSGDPEKLPSNSSLRRSYIELIRKGEKIGWGKGIYVY